MSEQSKKTDETPRNTRKTERPLASSTARSFTFLSCEWATSHAVMIHLSQPITCRREQVAFSTQTAKLEEIACSKWIILALSKSPNAWAPVKDGPFTGSRQTPFPGGWGNDDDDGIDYQTMEETFFIDVAGKKLSSTTIDLAGAASWCGSLCLAFGCTYIYMCVFLVLRP